MSLGVGQPLSSAARTGAFRIETGVHEQRVGPARQAILEVDFVNGHELEAPVNEVAENRVEPRAGRAYMAEKIDFREYQLDTVFAQEALGPLQDFEIVALRVALEQAQMTECGARRSNRRR